MPQGGLLELCGKDGKLQRQALVEMKVFFDERDISNAALKFYISMQYMYTVVLYCYFGAKTWIDDNTLIHLVTELHIVENFFFNIGYMWTDIVMLIVGRPGETQTDYAYYVAFYVGDFIFRWLFKEQGDGNCWYPWVVCGS